MLLSFWVLSTMALPNVVGEDPSLEDSPIVQDISFQPNVIPFLNVTSRVGMNNESFRFEWLNNTFDLELFFNATYKNETRLFSLRDLEDDFNITVQYIANKNETHCQFGWVVDDVENVSSLIHNAWFKIEDCRPFDYEDITIIEGLGENETSAFYLPDNLVLSFEDLEHKGFIIGHQDKTSMSVKGFSGKSSWDLDPITYSSPTITVTGYNETVPCTFWDVWNASNVNGWGAVFNYDNMTYFFNSSKLKIGSGGWFADTDVHVQFNTTSEIAIFNDSSKFRLGTLEDSVNKVTSGGVSVLFDLAGGANDVAYFADANSVTKFYGCTLESQSHQSIVYIYHNSAYVYLYNTMFVGLTFRMYYPHIDVCRFTQTAQSFGSGVGLYSAQSSDITLSDIMVEGNEVALYGGTGTITNLIARNNTYLISCWHVDFPNTYLINPDVDVWQVSLTANYVNEVYRQYTFDLTVTYPNGTAIQNANVTVKHYGQAETQDFTELTDSNGQITTKTLSMGFYNQTGGNTIYSYNPHEITITYSGTQTYTKNFTLAEQTEWTIALTPEPYNWFAATIIIGLFACFMVIYALTTKT